MRSQAKVFSSKYLSSRKLKLNLMLLCSVCAAASHFFPHISFDFKKKTKTFKYRPILATFWVILSLGICNQWCYTLAINWTFLQCSVVLIAVLFSQREGILVMYVPLLVNWSSKDNIDIDHCWAMSVIKASWTTTRIWILWRRCQRSRAECTDESGRCTWCWQKRL